VAVSTVPWGFVELRLWTVGFVRENVDPLDARSITFLDGKGEDGSLSFTVPFSSAAIVADPEILDYGFITVAAVLQANTAPVDVLVFEKVRPHGILVGEKGELELQVTCPGARHVTQYGVLWPERRTSWDTNSEDTRFFGWMSIDTSAWYDPSDWVTPGTYGTVNSALYHGAQKISADLTPALGDKMLARAEFTLPTANKVVIDWLCADEGSLWVDSEMVDTSTSGTHTTQRVKLVLAAGGHTIAIEATNTWSPVLEVAACVSIANADGNPGQIRRITDTTHWLVHKVIGGVKPGWTVGGMLSKLLQEAQSATQDCTDMLPMVVDFDETVDSDGNAWDVEPETGWLTGQTSLSDILQELQESGPCDVRVRPVAGVLTMQAFKDQGSDLSASVYFKQGVNVTRVEVQPRLVEATKALVRSLSRWLLVQDSGAVAKWGKRYKGVTAGTTSNPAKAQKIGRAALDAWADPPTTYTVTMVAETGCVPFYDFDTGDTVSVPDGEGGWLVLRVVAITGSTPAETPGPVTFTVELVTP
jgi:hypothetical protein